MTRFRTKEKKEQSEMWGYFWKQKATILILAGVMTALSATGMFYKLIGTIGAAIGATATLIALNIGMARLRANKEDNEENTWGNHIIAEFICLLITVMIVAVNLAAAGVFE